MGNEVEFVIFYTAFVLFVVILSGMSGFQILKNTGDIPKDTNFEWTQIFNVFLTLLFVGVVPEYQFILILVIVPYSIAMAYVIWKALPFT